MQARQVKETDGGGGPSSRASASARPRTCCIRHFYLRYVGPSRPPIARGNLVPGRGRVTTWPFRSATLVWAQAGPSTRKPVPYVPLARLAHSSVLRRGPVARA